MGTASVVSYVSNHGVNHMEELIHPSMWNNFNDIFERDDFFNAPPR
ncbi:MAG: hypothetical protein AAFZ15_34255 [Bacteroidota bacterium]